MQLYLWGLAVFGIMTVVTANPQPHHQNDPYTPAIAFLKALRKARKHSGGSGSGIFGNRDEDASGSSEGSSPSQSGSPSGSQSQNQPSVPILFPSGSNSGSSSGSSGSGSNSDRLPQLPNFQVTPRPPSSPQDIQRINNGVSTILNGVRSFDLGQILRGAFIFPANNNVKSVANNVIDTIFGPIGGGGGGSGDRDAPSPPTRNY